MTVWKLWLALTRMVLTGRGRYDIGCVLWNSFDTADSRVTAVNHAANWQVGRLIIEDDDDRFAVLECLPDTEPVYKRVA